MNKKFKWIIFCIVGFYLIFRIASSVRFGYIDEDKSATEDAIQLFHDRLSNEQFDEIYKDMHPQLAQTRSREEFIKSMRDTRDKYGRVVEVTYSKLNVIVGAPVQIRAVYNTTYEKGKTTEIFNYIREGNKVRIANYNIWLGTVNLGMD